MRLHLLACLVPLAAGCGDPLFFVEVEEKRVCVTQPGQAIDGPASGTEYPDLTAIWEGTYYLGEQIPGLDQQGITGTLRLTEFTISVADGTADLSSVREATIVATAASGQAAGERTLLQIDRARSDATHLVLSGDADTNLLDYLSAGQLGYRVELAGTPPSGSWVADMEACMSAKVMVDALKAIQ